MEHDSAFFIFGVAGSCVVMCSVVFCCGVGWNVWLKSPSQPFGTLLCHTHEIEQLCVPGVCLDKWLGVVFWYIPYFR
jgi:hypothetical protein